MKIWTYDELTNSHYKNDIVYKCCNFKCNYYENNIWLFEKDIQKLDAILKKYKNKANIYCEPVNVFDLNGNYLRASENINQESIQCNVRSYDIYLCCEGKRKSIHGLIFKYKNKPFLYENGRKEGNKKRETQMSHIKRKIIQYDLNMNIIKIWYSATEIYNELHYGRGVIINNCKGKTKTSHGFIWRYYDEELLNNSSIFIG